ncbi:MAG: lytic transglycosylase domain-containing protein [Cupriavidus necator]
MASSRQRRRRHLTRAAASAAAAALLSLSQAHATCWQAAAERYRIDPLLLYAIAQTESGLDTSARHRNRDGSRDIGLMQVNSRHLAQLAPYGITEAMLQADACLSVMAGAWVLGGFVQQLGYGWEAVGAYNAGSAPGREALRARYARRVWDRYLPLLRRRQALAAGEGAP